MDHCIEEVKIFFYSEDKEEFLLNHLIPFLRGRFKDYFIDRDWHEGPNFTITIKDLDERKKSEIINFVSKKTDQFKIDEALFIKEKNKYMSASKDLVALEKRTPVNKINNHMAVTFNQVDMKNIMEKYNSLKQYEMYIYSRFEMQEANNGILEELNSNKENRHVILVDLFIYIASLFEDGVSKGYLSYVSHVQGFFSLFRKREINLDGKFENIYQELKSEIKGLDNEEKKINIWKNEWQKVINIYYEDFGFDKYKEDEFYNLDNQYDNLVENMEGLEDSMFHNLLLKNKLKELYFSKNMIVFRNIVNTFYKVLPFMGVSFMEKHLYGYMAYRYIEDNIIHDTWENNFSNIISENRRGK